MKKMIVIYGKMDSGKTHTMWLVLSHLLNQGAKLIDMYHVTKPLDYHAVMSSKGQLPDFRAVVELNGKKVMLLSAGDFLNHYYWGFLMHIKWAIETHVDYVICCSRSRNTENSIHRYLMENYRGAILADKDWYWVEKVDSNTDWLKARDEVAKKIAAKLKATIDMENRPMSTIEFLWRVSQQLIVAKDRDMQQICGFGSGFFIQHQNRLFFATADHVLHWDDHKQDKRIISSEDKLFIANNVKGEGLSSAYTPLGDFYFFDKLNFSDLLQKNAIDIKNFKKPELQDYAFCLRKNEFQCPFLTHELSDDEGNVIVPSRLDKLIISSKVITEPNHDDYYIVAGCVQWNVVDGIRIDRINAVHQDMQYKQMENDRIILACPEDVTYEYWAGLSGSPVLNQDGLLLGIAVAIREKSNEIEVVPIKEVLDKMNYVLKLS